MSFLLDVYKLKQILKPFSNYSAKMEYDSLTSLLSKKVAKDLHL